MIIKATRLQAWAPAEGVGSRVGRRHPLRKQEVFCLYWGLFCYFFLHMGAFLLRFSHFGGLHHVGVFLLLFTSWWRPFFWACPPPPPTKISAGAHDCKEGSRACSREIFLCDHNLVSSGHVLLRFCLKNDKNNDKL